MAHLGTGADVTAALQLLAAMKPNAVPGATLVAATYSRVGSTPVQFQVNSDGFVYVNEGAGLTSRYQWMTGVGPSSGYEVKSDITGGSPGSFTTDPSAGAYLSCGTTRLWERASSAPFDRNVIATFTIRDASTLAVYASVSITLDCDMS